MLSWKKGLIALSSLGVVAVAIAANSPYDAARVTKFAVNNPAMTTPAPHGGHAFSTDEVKAICGDLKAAANVVNAEGACRKDAAGNVWSLVKNCCSLKKEETMNCIHNYHNITFNCFGGS